MEGPEPRGKSKQSVIGAENGLLVSGLSGAPDIRVTWEFEMKTLLNAVLKDVFVIFPFPV